jgi:adenylate cyclase class 2
MQTELEAKFLNIDKDDMRQRLKVLGAVLVTPERKLERQNFDFADSRLNKLAGWVRIRDEGEQITLTYKQLNERTLDGTKEINLTVDSFDQARELLYILGLEIKSEQVTMRESWKFGDTQIEIDTWPWIPPFVELEGLSENDLRAIARKLNLDWDLAKFGSVEVAYQAVFDVTEAEVYLCPKITFTNVPDWLEARRRKEILK